MNSMPVTVHTSAGIPAPPSLASTTKGGNHANVDFNPFDSPAALNNTTTNDAHLPPHHHHYGHHDSSVRNSDKLGNHAGGDLSASRYVAGNQFYNHEMYGSLRKGGEVSLFSKHYIGLVAATSSSVIAYSALQGCIRPLMQYKLGLSQSGMAIVARLIELPMLLSVVIGLLADCYPIRGTRRKSYMIVGMVVNASGVLGLAALSAHLDSLGSNPQPNTSLVVLAVLMMTIASFGCLITYLCVHTRTIELSQQESLRRRGAIQATYLVVRRIAGYVATLYTTAVIGDKPQQPTMSLFVAMLLLAGLCLLPLPLVVCYWYEETYSLATTLSTRSRIFWKVMQQKAVWRTLAFICCFTLFLTIRFYDSTAQIKNWSGFRNESLLAERAILETVIFIVIVVWRLVFMNRPWRPFFAGAPLFLIAPWLLLAIMTCFDVVRSAFFYRTMSYVSFVSDGVMAFVNIVPLTEIIQEGSEGVTVGLVLTLQRVIGIFVSTNSKGLFKGNNFYSLQEVQADTNDARWDVFLSLLLSFGIQALAVFGLFFLPNQKLDAQQLRMYGGFTKGATVLIIAFVAAFVLYSLVVLMMLTKKSWACYPIAGGTGC